MAALLVAMVGCNKEIDSPDDGGISSADKVYMTFSIQTMTTRSATDAEGSTNSDANPDYEVGTNEENQISKVDIVLCNNDSYVVANDVVPTGTGSTYIASFNSLSITSGTTYDIYIYANCDAPATKNLDAITSVSVADMTAANQFWMTNAYQATQFTTPADMSVFTSPASPLNLGSHYVERSMARFDMMPVSEFEIGNGIYVNLTHAAIINQAKDSYMLRRVSVDGTATNWVVGGVETPNNYVVSPAYARTSDGWNGQDLIAVKNGEILTSLMVNEKSTWDWKALSSTTADNWDGDTHSSGYYIWQYCKEHTIAGRTNQFKGFITGIVFKGLIDSDDDTILAAMGAKKTIYVFENIMYGAWEDVEAAAQLANAPATLVAAVAEVNSASEDAKGNGQAYTLAGFTGYTPATDGKYYTYYYYWNRHNDNGNPAEMGPMEFAVVRNNVYKLCVDKIAKLGHPENPGLDPDPEYPDEPAESLNYYFNVTAKVLPWVVRVNHIEF